MQQERRTERPCRSPLQVCADRNRVRDLIAPRLKELTRNVGNVPAGTKVLDAKAWVRRVEGLLPWHRKLNHPSLSVAREQCGPVIAEKGWAAYWSNSEPCVR